MIDGDTLELAGERVRLIGIDAPEGAQVYQRDGRDWACGDEAAAALGDLVAADVRVQTRWATTGRDGRWRCASAGGVELNREMVQQGWALAWYPEREAVSGPAYDAEQLEAEQAQRGLWSGSFVPPREWRQR